MPIISAISGWIVSTSMLNALAAISHLPENALRLVVGGVSPRFVLKSKQHVGAGRCGGMSIGISRLAEKAPQICLEKMGTQTLCTRRGGRAESVAPHARLATSETRRSGAGPFLSVRVNYSGQRNFANSRAV